MTNFAESLRQVTDDAATPIELDEVAHHQPVPEPHRPAARRPVVAVGAAVAVLLIGAAAWRASDRPEAVTAGPDESTTTATLSPDQARAEVEEFLLMRGASTQRDLGFTTLGQLASVVSPAVPLGDFSLVVGRVTGVEGLAGFYSGEGDDEATTYMVEFDDPQAMWRAVVLDVQIDETLVGDLAGAAQVGVVLPVTLDLDTARTAFESYGTVVLPLSASPVFEQAPGVWSILADGELMITVEDDGRLDLPFTPTESAEILLADAPTLEDLRAQASRRPDN
jgi:hypothetical protein